MPNFEDDSLRAKIKFDQYVNKDPDQDIINVNIQLDSVARSDEDTDDREEAQNLIINQQEDVISSGELNNDVNAGDVNSHLVRSSSSSDRFTVIRPSQKATLSIHKSNERKNKSSQNNNSWQQEQPCSSKISLSKRLVDHAAPTRANLGAHVVSKTPIGRKDAMFRELIEQEQPCCSGINSKPRVNEAKVSKIAKASRRSSKSPKSFAKEADELLQEQPCSGKINLVKRVNETKVSERAKAVKRSSKSPIFFAKEADRLQQEQPCSSGINLMKRENETKVSERTNAIKRSSKSPIFFAKEADGLQKEQPCSSGINLLKRSIKTGASNEAEADFQRKSKRAKVFPKLKDNLRKENPGLEGITSRKRKLTPGKYGSGFPFGKRMRHPGMMSPYEVDSSSDEESLLGKYHLVRGVPFVKRTNLKKDAEEKSTVRGKRKFESLSDRVVAKKLRL